MSAKGTICKQCNEREVSKIFHSYYCDKCIEMRFKLLESGLWKITDGEITL